MAEQEATVEEPVATAKPTVDESIPLVLVTGATGFIATHVLKLLLTEGKYRVRGTVRSLKSEEKIAALRNLVPDAKYPLDLCEAELSNKDGWIEAVKGCTYVYHIASPFPLAQPKNADVLIRPAVEGTTNVLSACAESGSVKRVVVTSSIAAISCGLGGHPGRAEHNYTEEDWSPEAGCPPYERSKVLAEKAAWDFVKELPDEKKFELAVVNPAFVLGPALTKSAGASIDFVRNILDGKIPGYVDVYFPVVDVRDVAQAHLVAMEKPECNGKRYCLVRDSAVPFQQIMQMLADEFNPKGFRIKVSRIPKFIAWIGSYFSSDMKTIYPLIGRKIQLSNDRMVNELAIQPQPVKETLTDSGNSLIELGLVVPKVRQGCKAEATKKPKEGEETDDQPVDTGKSQEGESKEEKPQEEVTPPADASNKEPDQKIDDTKGEEDEQPEDTTPKESDTPAADVPPAESEEKPSD